MRAAAVDVVGTGGDRAHTVNISTMAAIVVAGAGRTGGQARQPGRLLRCAAPPTCWSTSASRSTSARTGWPRCVAEAGIGFCFAARFHPGMRHAAVPRRELGVPTVFNFLGPLTNPARPRAGAVGCSDPRMAPVMAEVFARRGDSVLVMRGEDGLDEFTTAAPTRVWVVRGRHGRPSPWSTRSTSACPRSRAGDLRGGDAAVQRRRRARRLFAGETGPVRDAVLLNAAAALAAHAGFPGDLADRCGPAWPGPRRRSTPAPPTGTAGPLGDRRPGRQGRRDSVGHADAVLGYARHT